MDKHPVVVDESQPAVGCDEDVPVLKVTVGDLGGGQLGNHVGEALGKGGEHRWLPQVILDEADQICGLDPFHLQHRIPLTTLDSDAAVEELEADLPGIAELGQVVADGCITTLLVLSITGEALDGPPSAIVRGYVEDAGEIAADRSR